MRSLSLTRRDPFTWRALWLYVLAVGALTLIDARGMA